jgi:MFS family permease
LKPSPDNQEKLLKTAGYYAGFVGLGAAAGVIGPTLPGLAQLTHSPLGQLGFLFTARSLGYLTASCGGGKIYDRLPGHPVMTAALVGMAAILGLVPVLPLLHLRHPLARVCVRSWASVRTERTHVQMLYCKHMLCDARVTLGRTARSIMHMIAGGNASIAR